MTLGIHKQPPRSVLEPVGLLYGCARDELSAIADASRVVDAPVGAVLCEQGRVALDCMLVERGRADVLVGGRRVGTIGTGETIGEMGVVGRAPRSATVIARSPMRVRVIDAQDIDAVLDRAPTFARALLRELAARLRTSNHQPAGTPPGRGSTVGTSPPID
jgi:CRP-like cAMP-binding protein